MARGGDTTGDPFSVLGLEPGAGVAAIMAARRSLAKLAHPDAGGSLGAMQQLNVAVEAAIAIASADRSSAGSSPAPGRRRDHRPTERSGVRRDHPSFTIEALPAEAYEGLLIAAATIGDLAHDDPPYLLEAVLGAPVPAWCRLEVVPDAGASTISITTSRIPGHPTPDVLDVRDLWIAALNQLDWEDLDSPRQP
ncbi:MAG: J domain-containing protein [Ilumatobacteraceae bacterium]